MKQKKFQSEQIKLRSKFIKSGVKMIAPETVFFSKNTKIGKNVTIDPYVVISDNVSLGNNVRILSRITIEDKVVLKNLSFSEINFDDDDDIKNLVDKLKIIYEDHWKIFNRINTSIKMPIFIKLNSDDNLKVSNFDDAL